MLILDPGLAAGCYKYRLGKIRGCIDRIWEFYDMKSLMCNRT